MLLAQRQHFRRVHQHIARVLDAHAVLPVGEERRSPGIVGAPGVSADEPFPYEILASFAQFGCLVQRYVAQMQLIDVDPIGAQPPQRRGQCAARVRGSCVLTDQRAGLLVEHVAPLGGDDHLVPPTRERPPQYPFAAAGAVHVSSIEEGDPELRRPTDRRDGFLVVDGAPPEGVPVGVLPLTADGPAPESQRTDLDLAVSQRSVLHA